MSGPSPTSRSVTALRMRVLLTLIGGAGVALAVGVGCAMNFNGGGPATATGASVEALMVVDPPRESPLVAATADAKPTVTPIDETGFEDVIEPDAPRVEMKKPVTPIAPAMFDGRPLRQARTMRMLVTAYSPDEKSCGKWAKYKTTASGFSVWTNGMKLVAADTKVLPFHSIVSIPGYDNAKPVPVLDRGGKIKGNHLDVLFATDEAAKKWGAKWLNVTIWEYE